MQLALFQSLSSLNVRPNHIRNTRAALASFLMQRNAYWSSWWSMHICHYFQMALRDCCHSNLPLCLQRLPVTSVYRPRVDIFCDSLHGRTTTEGRNNFSLVSSHVMCSESIETRGWIHHGTGTWRLANQSSPVPGLMYSTMLEFSSAAVSHIR